MRLLPKFLCRWIALYLAWTSPEYGGLIYDYANGKLVQLHQWNTDQGLKEAMAIVDSVVQGSRDEIYIVVVKCGLGKGYFVVEYTGKIIPWVRAFSPGVYEFPEACLDAMAKCRKIADKLGFRKPEVQLEAIDN